MRRAKKFQAELFGAQKNEIVSQDRTLSDGSSESVLLSSVSTLSEENPGLITNKAVLVTGGAGFVGSHLVDRIVEDNPSRIIVIDNFFLGNEENLAAARHAHPDIKVMRLDAGDLSAIQDVVLENQIETVFDLAVVPLPTSLRFPDWTVRSNVGIATTMCEIARRGLVSRLVHFSSSEAYGTARYVPMDEDHPHDSLTPYAASKSAGDHVVSSYVQTFGIHATIVRPFNTIGPRQNPGSYAGIVPLVVRKVLRGEPIEIHGDGNQTRDLTFVRETADFAVRIHEAAVEPGMILNVGTGRETSMVDLVARILRIMGKPEYPTIHVAARPGDVRRHCGDVDALRRLVGATPQALTDEALAETVDWYRNWPG